MPAGRQGWTLAWLGQSLSCQPTFLIFFFERAAAYLGAVPCGGVVAALKCADGIYIRHFSRQPD